MTSYPPNLSIGGALPSPRPQSPTTPNPNAGPGRPKKPTTNRMNSEMLHLLYSMGDSQSNSDTAHLLESMVTDYIHALSSQSYRLATKRGGKLKLDDVLHVLKRDSPKFARATELLVKIKEINEAKSQMVDGDKLLKKGKVDESLGAGDERDRGGRQVDEDDGGGDLELPDY